MFRLRVCFCFCSSSEVGDCHATQGRGMCSPGPSGLTETPREDGDECDGLFLPTDGGWVPQGPVVRRAGLRATPPRQQEWQRVVGAQGGAPGARTSATRKETRKGAPQGAPRGRAPRKSCLLDRRFDLLVEVESSRCFVCEFVFVSVPRVKWEIATPPRDGGWVPQGPVA
jgi:hypothetical protein